MMGWGANDVGIIVKARSMVWKEGNTRGEKHWLIF